MPPWSATTAGWSASAGPVVLAEGRTRILAIVLAGGAGSRITDVWVLRQFQPHSLEDHLANGRPSSTTQ